MSMFSKALHKIEKGISNVIPHQHSADRRAAMEATQAQIQSYKDQKEQQLKEQERIAAEKKIENAKLNEKSAKAAHIAYRAPGFMEEASTGLSNTLG